MADFKSSRFRHPFLYVTCAAREVLLHRTGWIWPLFNCFHVSLFPPVPSSPATTAEFCEPPPDLLPPPVGLTSISPVGLLTLASLSSFLVRFVVSPCFRLTAQPSIFGTRQFFPRSLSSFPPCTPSHQVGRWNPRDADGTVSLHVRAVARRLTPEPRNVFLVLSLFSTLLSWVRWTDTLTVTLPRP